MENDLVDIEPSETLRLAYIEATIKSRLRDLEQELHSIRFKPASDQNATTEQERMLLDQESGKLIADRLKIPGLATEIKRAVQQVEKSLRAKRELGEEKKELEDATQKPK